MATMTLRYNSRSKQARIRLNEMLSWGVFTIVEPKVISSVPQRNARKTTDENVVFMSDLRGALSEARQYLDGKIELMKAEDILNEL